MAWTDPPRTWVTAETVTAAQLNAHIRDQLKAAFPLSVGPTFTTWSPSYGNLTIGNGTVSSRYTQTGDLVVAWFFFTLGSTSSVGTDPLISTPVTGHASYTNLSNSVGDCVYTDAGTERFGGRVVLTSSRTNFLIRVWDATTTNLQEQTLTSTVPFTWTTNDLIMFTATYEAE